MTITISQTVIEVLLAALKILIVFHGLLIAVPFMVLWERKLIARMQQRPGPNRVGPFGLLQTIVDGAKLFLKEELRPTVAESGLHWLAPLLTVVPAIVVLAIVPIGPAVMLHPVDWGFTVPLIGLTIAFDSAELIMPLGITDLEIGILFYLAITSIGVYGIVLAGWASNSKYSLLGGIRSSAQMLSYELALGLSLVGVLLIAGTFELRTIIGQQDGGFWNWHIWNQPVGFCLFLVAGFAETNRLPFDLPEGEGELGSGFHTEYSSMKFALFFQAEYMNMFTFSAILTTLFLGGYHGPFPSPFAELGALNALWGVFWFLVKIFLLITFMIVVRGTLPRFRYDQLMDLGWKVMFPMALINMMLTAGVLVFFSGEAGLTREDLLAHPVTAGLTMVLLVVGIAQIIFYDRILTIRKKRILGNAV